ncbi:complement component 1 Q subcomponent-binding protein, mitochondrial isoform X1 [Anthonomus grandis grandis]|uniref:complement component 1 Q subcomponent-binding protein, mitochondrial isoform X1 n=1 Tax=Anthonomus grandis grandis TaxID=2921223 RepID=UPI002165572E|nr:complement component 1 Q subcomponent-binding protein, mitochondrial isoform X1 [Anthonomus grandis grandis]
MNTILKTAVRMNGLRALLNPVKNMVSLTSAQNPTLVARNLWHLSSQKSKLHSNLCSCGCGGSRGAHTKGKTQPGPPPVTNQSFFLAEKELVEFLTEEILAERKAQKVKAIPTELDGFKASLNGAEVSLTKKTDAETITISFNVNHSVDTEAEPEIHPDQDKPEIGELKSKPAFKIDLVRGETTVSVLCSFVTPSDQDDGYNDGFGIDELSIYNGEWNENIYSVSGEVLDSYLYDLILNYLEEKGISNEFVEKLSDYSTAYEHSAYIGLLEGLSKFVSNK